MLNFWPLSCAFCSLFPDSQINIKTQIDVMAKEFNLQHPNFIGMEDKGQQTFSISASKSLVVAWGTTKKSNSFVTTSSCACILRPL
jgi:predicted 3-demethylubiquinone-9 3-methyltransferase (glyoxalase superfamily)